jgi:hypothetical protein
VECRLRIFVNRVLRKIFVPKKDEVTGEWRRLHNKELHALYSSPNIIRVIKSRTLRWGGHVTRMGEGEVHAGFWWGSLGERDHLEDPSVGGKIFKWIFKKRNGWYGVDRSAQVKDRWRAVVNAVVNTLVP